MQLLKKIFSVTNEYISGYKYKNIIFFGIRIKFRVRFNDYFRKYESAILDAWTCNGVTNGLLNQFEFICSRCLWYEFNYKIWLIYVAALLEIEKEEKAKQILRMYIDKYNLLEIESLLPVADFAYRLGYSNEKICKAHNLFIQLEKNKNLIYDSLANKTVAIVGNGSQELGKKKGREIDAHDIVIRFNKIYKQKGFEEDYGCKTDIWIKNFETINDFELNKEANLELNRKIPICAIKKDYWHSFIDVDMYETAVKGSQNICPFFTREEVENSRFLIESMFHESTAGFLLVANIYCRFKSFDNIDFYGFGFLDDDFKPLNHFFEKLSCKNQIDVQNVHNFYEESVVLKRLIMNKQFDNRGVLCQKK